MQNLFFRCLFSVFLLHFWVLTFHRLPLWRVWSHKCCMCRSRCKQTSHFFHKSFKISMACCLSLLDLIVRCYPICPFLIVVLILFINLFIYQYFLFMWSLFHHPQSMSSVVIIACVLPCDAKSVITIVWHFTNFISFNFFWHIPGLSVLRFQSSVLIYLPIFHIWFHKSSVLMFPLSIYFLKFFIIIILRW